MGLVSAGGGSGSVGSAGDVMGVGAGMACLDSIVWRSILVALSRLQDALCLQRVALSRLQDAFCLQRVALSRLQDALCLG